MFASDMGRKLTRACRKALRWLWSRLHLDRSVRAQRAITGGTPAAHESTPHDLAVTSWSEGRALVVPTPATDDHTLAGLRTLVSLVPYVGSPALEILSATVVPPIQRRQREWMQEVANRLMALEQAGLLKISDLGTDEEFLSALVQAAQAAQRTHYREKLDALRNAVLNTATTVSDHSQDHYFIHLVDVLSPTHLVILRFFRDPLSWFPSGHPLLLTPVRSTAEILKVLVPTAPGGESLLDQLITDLADRGLIADKSMRVTRTLNAWRKRTTRLGNAFLEYVSSPIPDDYNGMAGDSRATD